MTQKQMLYFKKACEFKNIALAAEALFVSRSVVSRAVQELEEEFKITLFERSKLGVVPTEAGAMLYEMFAQMDGYYRTISRRFEKLSLGAPSREFRVGMTPTNSSFVGRLLFEQFAPLYPDVAFCAEEFAARELPELLTSGRIDMMVSPHMISDFSFFESIDLYDVHFVVAMSAEDPLASRRCLTVADLLDRPVAYMGIPLKPEKVIEAAFAAYGKKQRVVLRSSDVELLHHLSASGQIYVILPDNMIKNWSDVTGVRFDVLDDSIAHRLVWCKTLPESSGARDLIAFVKKLSAEGEL